MSADLSFAPLMLALAARIESLDAFDGFSITDRPPAPSALPHLRLGPVRQTPWSTASSLGVEINLTLTLTSRNGSFGPVSLACEALAASLLADGLQLSRGIIVTQHLAEARLEHDPAGRLERAIMTLKALVDLGDL
jgi:hypothetical protein